MNRTKNVVVWIVVAVFFVALLSFSMTYSVRFTEAAVLTTFGKASEDASRHSEPGLKFKAPYPIQSVTKYDTRQRFLQARSETQQTADNFQIIVEGYAMYRVSDPLTFYRRFSSAGNRSTDHFRQAEEMLRSRLRSALGETSKYQMNELFNQQAGGSKLPQLEAAVQTLISGESQAGESLAEYGIEVTSVGIDRIVLPEETTKNVMERMKENRSRLAAEYSAEGQAIARGIKASAEADAQRIRAFAEARAKEIIAKGEQEAAQYLAMQNTHPELAVFIANIDLLRETLARRVTLVLSVKDFGMRLFSPSALRDLGANELPVNVPDIEMGLGGMQGGSDE